MADYLFIRLEPDTDDCTTVVLNGEGRLLESERRCPLTDAARATDGRRVVVLVPGPEIIAAEAMMPQASPSRLRQMLPYSLEDTFAEDIERLHFAPGGRLPSGALAVAVVAKASLEAWLETVRAAGIEPDAIYAESEGIADVPSTLTLLLEGDRIYGRRAGRRPFVFDGVRLPQLFELLEAEGGDERTDLQHIQIYLDAGAGRYHGPTVEGLRSRAASVDVKALADGALSRFGATLVHHPAPNLLQGAYARKSNWAELGRPWYATAALFAGLIVLVVIGQAAEYFKLRSEDRALAESAAALCQQAFGTARLTTCESSARRALSDAGQQTTGPNETFLTTLATIAEFRTNDSIIDGLSYRNAVMDLQVIAPSVPVLNTLAEQISDTERFEVRIQQAVPNDSRVEGRLQVVGVAR
jgi:general secretion pathway protein L